MYRLCGERDKPISHVTSECKKIAQKCTKCGHDKDGQANHWKLCHTLILPTKDNWYDRSREDVMENDLGNVLWDFRVQNVHHLEHNRPDIVVLEK